MHSRKLVVVCPACLKQYDRRLLRRKEGEYYCPDIHCVGVDYKMAKPDLILWPITKKLMEKEYFLNLDYHHTSSGVFSSDGHTTLEFCKDCIPDTLPEGFVIKNLTMSSIFPENERLDNYHALLSWVNELDSNPNSDQVNFPEGFDEIYRREVVDDVEVVD